MLPRVAKAEHKIGETIVWAYNFMICHRIVTTADSPPIGPLGPILGLRIASRALRTASRLSRNSPGRRCAGFPKLDSGQLHKV